MFRVPGKGLEEEGYYNLFPIHGVNIWGQYMEFPDSKFPMNRPAAGIFPDRRPRYIPTNHPLRQDKTKAEGLIESFLPGINLNYLKLGIAAIGFSQGRDIIPLVFCTGKSGAGKSAIPMLAAGFCGMIGSEVPYQQSWERYRQGIMQSLGTTSLIVTNEILKEGAKFKLDGKTTLDPFLSLTVGSRTHVMYQGPMEIPRAFAQFVTDISLDQAIKADIQHGRRWIMVNLERRVPDWKRTLNSSGVSNLSLIRNHSSMMAEAADCVVSEVIDKYFKKPMVMEDIAKDLGFDLLMHTSDYQDNVRLMKDFFHLVNKAPALTGNDLKKFSGRGWKKIVRDYVEGDELSETWTMLANDKKDGWIRSRFIEAEDWNAVLEIPYELCRILVEIKNYGNNVVYVRFKNEPVENPTAVNAEILGSITSGPEIVV
jgi:hypothetical protein